MKKAVVIMLAALYLCFSCGPKPYYETTTGKKKLKHYNKLQFGLEH